MQIWIDTDKTDRLQDALQTITGSKFIKVGDKTINSADITGIFPAADLDEFIRIKRGEWKCKKGKWHAKNEECTGHFEHKDFEPPVIVNPASKETVDKVRENLRRKFNGIK
jgi:hypothetical protein